MKLPTMRGVPTIAKAEKKALEGQNESQDSQLILEKYQSEFGIGFTSSSPPRDSTARQIEDGRQELAEVLVDQALVELAVATSTARLVPQPRPTTEYQQHPSVTDAVPKSVVDTNLQPSKGSAPKSSLTWEPDGVAIVPDTNPTNPQCSIDDITIPLAKSDVLPRDLLTGIPPKRANMEVSQQSPTQNNDDRDYERYFDNQSQVSTSPRRPPSGPLLPIDAISNGHRTLHEDDTGAVDFGNISHLGHHESEFMEEPSSMPEDSGVLNTKGAWRMANSSPQQTSSLRKRDGPSLYHPADFAPETPAPPHNPFAGNRLVGPALAGSQLFHQTQFSSAIKGISPTSSRPSPNLFAHNSISPNLTESSPLKNRVNITSPTNCPSSTPQLMRRALPRPRADEELTPTNTRSTEDAMIPESPQYIPASKRSVPQPMDNYEPMRKSQERKSSDELLAADSSDSDSDEVANAMQRRKRAMLKKEAAAKQLTAISLVRAGRRDIVEIPSTTKKEKVARTEAEGYIDQCHGKDPSETEDDEGGSTVADSQDPATDPNPEVTRFHGSPQPRPSSLSSRSTNGAVPDSTEEELDPSHPERIRNVSISDSVRPIETVPETSPTTTQANPIPLKHQDSSGERITATAPSPPISSRISSNASHSAPSTEPPEPSLPKPSRRSSRKSRPSLKAQSMRADVFAIPTSDIAVGDKAQLDSVANATSHAMASKRDANRRQDNPEGYALLVTEHGPIEPRDIPSSPPLLSSRASLSNVPSTALPASDPKQNPTTPVAPPSTAPAQLHMSTSTLSALSTTPLQSSTTTPATQESAEQHSTSPAKAKGRRRTAESLPKLKTDSGLAKRGAARQLRRQIQLDSASTDELTRSPSVTGFENSMIQLPKTSTRESRLPIVQNASKDHIHRPAKLFNGMAFAISFQSRKPGESPEQYEKRLVHSKDIEKIITHAGGRLLASGFDELFDSNALKSTATSPVTEFENEDRLILSASYQSLGFTALIADGHSRKVKYMQALALGLPCISDRWITMSVDKGAIVDWLPYLLCAGQSTFLRDAIRSRYLAPYPAAEAKLVHVVGQRPKLLHGSKILLVMKKSRAEDKKMPYVFLAHVLGASLSRAYSIDEAKEALRNREALGDPFDWVYVDENTATEEELFSAVSADVVPTNKKRKRPPNAGAGDEAGPPPKRIRTLSDELVIQSLILGRMLEEDELKG